MKWIIRLLVASAIAYLLAEFLPGVNVTDYGTAIWFAFALGLLNMILRPILIILTLPLTIFTLGLFLLVINTVVVLIAGNLVDGFIIDSFWHGLLFSVLYSFATSLLFNEENKQRKQRRENS